MGFTWVRNWLPVNGLLGGALQWLRYATGVDFAEGDDGVEALQDAFRANDNIKDLLVAIAKSDVFRYLGNEEVQNEETTFRSI